MKWIVEAIDERRAAITATVYWPPLWVWQYHLQLRFNRDIGLNN